MRAPPLDPPLVDMVDMVDMDISVQVYIIGVLEMYCEHMFKISV